MLTAECGKGEQMDGQKDAEVEQMTK
uniref:Uncharacterized protein n=1 Tax=Anguilla anguilla TaxID=7936 RepID=A0A0E9QCF1_ANGAN